MATGVKTKPSKSGLFQGYFTDYTGKRRYFTAPTRSEAKEIAREMEVEHRLIHQGVRPVPQLEDRHRVTPVSEVMSDYMAWGEAQGGRNGKPWSAVHAHNRSTHLQWWANQLKLRTMADLDDIQAHVERELQQLQKAGRTGKTISSYAETLRAFCHWCLQRRFLADDPLKYLVPFDSSPRVRRRAVTADEITRVLAACTPDRRLLYETAFLTGLRVSELRHLTLEHLDENRGGLVLDEDSTKNRQPGFQPVPQGLLVRLHASAVSGSPSDQYATNGRRGRGKSTAPEYPLLYVPSHPARIFDQDLEAAAIPKWTSEGKLDFHACRTAYINLVLEYGGVTPKEAQALARHSTPDLTFNVYGRTRNERLSEAVERIAKVVSRPKRVPGEYRRAVGAETENATPSENKELRSVILGSPSVPVYEPDPHGRARGMLASRPQKRARPRRSSGLPATDCRDHHGLRGRFRERQDRQRNTPSTL